MSSYCVLSLSSLRPVKLGPKSQVASGKRQVAGLALKLLQLTRDRRIRQSLACTDGIHLYVTCMLAGLQAAQKGLRPPRLLDSLHPVLRRDCGRANFNYFHRVPARCKITVSELAPSHFLPWGSATRSPSRNWRPCLSVRRTWTRLWTPWHPPGAAPRWAATSSELGVASDEVWVIAWHHSPTAACTCTYGVLKAHLEGAHGNSWKHLLKEIPSETTQAKSKQH